MSFLLLRWAINAGALMALPYLIDGVAVDGPWSAAKAALVLGLTNALIRPLLILLTLPITLLSLGGFILVINGLLFWGVANWVDGFRVSGFVGALAGALLYSLSSWAVSVLLIPQNAKNPA